jgi:regulator of RNase E activity RraA
VAEERADSQVERLRPLDSCVVSDALDALGLGGAIQGLTPRWEGARTVGRAITMQLAPGPAPADQPKVHLGVRAIANARPGDVIVVANEGRLGMGSWGGLLSVGALAQGVAGVVTDGACRDVDEARELRFPVFARGSAVRTARGRVHEQSCGQPVLIDSVAVRTGDLVLADGTGVVVIAAEHADEVLGKAEEIAAREGAMVEEIRAGATLSTVLGVRYEDMLSAATGEKRG